MKLYNEEDINDIALAINEKGVTGTFTSDEFGDAVRSITGGGSGVDLTSQLTLTSDKQKTNSNVQLRATLGNYEYISSLGRNHYGKLKNAIVKFYKKVDGVNTLLGQSTTDVDGLATFDTTISETTDFNCSFEGLGVFESVNSSDYEVEYIGGYIYAPLLDGTENLYTIRGTPRFENNTLTGASCSYLTDSWDYTLNWKLECDFLFTGSNCGLIICPNNITSRDKNWIQLCSESTGLGIYYNGSENQRISLTLQNNVWYHLTLVKNGSNFSYSIGDNISGTFTFNPNWTNVSIGIDNWSGSANCILKNITVEEL